MSILTPGELLQALIDSCHKSTDSVLFVRGNNPYEISLNGNACRVYIANVTHAKRKDADEYRIQCPGELPKQLAISNSSGVTVCILGYHANSRTFSAWDPTRFLKRSRSTRRFSMYTRRSLLMFASREGFSRYIDADDQVILLFRSEYLALYIENINFIHQATDAELEEITDVYGSVPIGSVPKRRVSVAKRRIRVTYIQYARSPKFREEVLAAYGNRCAMCGVQLELIEAAHLVPHSHEQGLDVIGNGIALCAQHHKSLDTGLVYVDEDYYIHINVVRRAYLEKVKLCDGIAQYTRVLSKEIYVPVDIGNHPLKANIRLGNELRGIGVG